MAAHRTTWIKLHGDAFSNKKIAKAAGRLTRGDQEKLVGHLAHLWSWCVENAEDGDLSHLQPVVIAQAAGWRRDAKEFVRVLTEEGLLDEGPKVHDWGEYQGTLIQRRLKDRERKARVSVGSALELPTEFR